MTLANNLHSFGHFNTVNKDQNGDDAQFGYGIKSGQVSQAPVSRMMSVSGRLTQQHGIVFFEKLLRGRAPGEQLRLSQDRSLW